MTSQWERAVDACPAALDVGNRCIPSGAAAQPARAPERFPAACCGAGFTLAVLIAAWFTTVPERPAKT